MSRIQNKEVYATLYLQSAARNARPVLGRRVIYSHHINSMSKKKDIRRCALAMKLGGYAKVGKPGVIVIEGPEDACKQYCPTLVSLGWKYQQEVGAEQQEGPPGGTVDSMRKLPVGFEMLGEAKISELTVRCREAGLSELFFSSLNIHDSNAGAAAKQ